MACFGEKSGQNQANMMSEIKPGKHVSRTSMSLPKFSAKLESYLEKGDFLKTYKLFLTECAGHVIKCGDMNSKADYADFSRRLCEKYPCLRSSGGMYPWVSILRVIFFSMP